jgi:hypothetical protein
MRNREVYGYQEKSGKDGDREKPTPSPFPFNQRGEENHHHQK